MILFSYGLCLCALCAVACAILALLPRTDRVGRLAHRIGAFGCAAGCAVALCGVAAGIGTPAETARLPWGAPVGSGRIALDDLSRVFLLPVLGLGLTCALAGHGSLRTASTREHNLGAHWLCYVLLVLGMALVMTARDAVLFLLAWEVMSVSPFFLIDFNDADRSVRDASWVYLAAAHLGAVPLFALFAILWAQGGSTCFEAFEALGTTPLTPAVFLLALVGFGAKAGMFPLHVWLPEAHPAAPAHVSAILSGAMINAGLYGIMRTLRFLGPVDGLGGWAGWTLLLAGAVTGLTGIFRALAQNNIKRLLAYSSVENMGVMLLGTGAGLIGLHAGDGWIAALGFTGAVLHMLNHAAFKGLLFLCAGEVLHATGTVTMQRLGGLQKAMPLVGTLFAVGSMAIACLPPLNGFAGELVLALSLARGTALPSPEGRIVLMLSLAALALIGGCSAAAFAKAYGIAFLGTPRGAAAERVRRPGPATLCPLILPASVCLLGGVLADRWYAVAASTAGHLLGAEPGLAPEAAAAVASAGTCLGTVSAVGLGLLLVVGVLLAVRRILLAEHGVAEGPTWACGYRYGTPRIQYTDDSFAEPMTRNLNALMGVVVRRTDDPEAPFPREGHLGVKAPGRLLARCYAPLFEAFGRACDACKIIQHGHIHLYILHIIVTLIVLLAWAFKGGAS